MPKFYSVRTREGTASFRRGGKQFTRATPTVVADDAVTADQLKAIREEPKLEVTEIDEAEARKQGWAPDPRTLLEQHYGDYPPPGAKGSGLLNQETPAQGERQRQAVVSDDREREVAAGPTGSQRESHGAEPGSDAAAGSDTSGNKSKRHR